MIGRAMNPNGSSSGKSKLTALAGGGECRGPDALRPLTGFDRGAVRRDLLPVISSSYPGAEAWLERRLEDVIEGSARCQLARDLLGLRAIAIETPKAPGHLKLSTIWVTERARRQGLGSCLLLECRDRWLRHELEQVWVTVSPTSYPSISPLLLAHGFRQTGIDPDRYGEGRPEAIFTWCPDQEPVLSFRSPRAA